MFTRQRQCARIHHTWLGHACAAAALLLSACSGSPDAPGEPRQQAGDDVGTVHDEILGGATTTRVGVVAVQAVTGDCSGILLNRFTVLTAAHCFPAIPGNTTRNATVSVVYKQPVGRTTRTYCLTGGTDTTNALGFPICTTPSTYRVSVYPGYTQGTFDSAHDLAVVKSDKAFVGVTPADYAVINAGHLPASLDIYGWGLNSETGGLGTLRVGSGVVGAIYSQDFDLVESATRNCEGDSGGPASLHSTSTTAQLVVEGLASLGDGTSKCSAAGEPAQFTRLSPKIDFIQSKAGVTCRQAVDSASGNSIYSCSYPTIGILAIVNGKYVTAENAGASPLIARADSIGSWERFELIDNSDGTSSFVSEANDLVVTAENAGADQLIARASRIDSWEKFSRVSVIGLFQGFIAVNGKFVTAEDAGASPLIARADTMGAWEQFMIVFP